MIKTIIYTNDDGEDFTFTKKEDSLEFRIERGNSSFHLLSPEEVDEFCELLQEYKKQTWNEAT